MKSGAFHFSPKIHHAFGLLWMQPLSPGTFKNRPIWSHPQRDAQLEMLPSLIWPKQMYDFETIEPKFHWIYARQFHWIYARQFHWIYARQFHWIYALQISLNQNTCVILATEKEARRKLSHTMVRKFKIVQNHQCDLIWRNFATFYRKN